MVVDELMSAWKGIDALYNVNGMPHVSKQMRKPEGVGAEIKAVADGTTTIIMRLDIMEGKEQQSKKEFADLKKEGTAITLRLMKPWFSSGRVVHADSAFSSVFTLLECRKRGLHFMGLVKTAHVEFPSDYLKAQASNFGHDSLYPRGGYILLQSIADPNGVSHPPIFALGWYDAQPKYLVSSCGSTVPGTPSIRPRQRIDLQDGEFVTVSYEKTVPRPKMVEDFFATFSNIDVHDHYRQGSLEMERHWITRNWTHRIFTTIFGICIVDAFLAHRFEKNINNDAPMDFTAFCGQLSRELIENPLVTPRQTRSATKTPTAEEIQVYTYLFF
jgi:hypothetical protein